MKNSMIWAEMARRKKQFHPKESWDTIILWTLHHPSEVKHLVRRGLLIPYDTETPRCWNWYYPSIEAWEKYIEPLMKYSLNRLLILSGWKNVKGQWADEATEGEEA